MNYQTIISFWFDEIDRKKWWLKDDSFDQTIRDSFGEVHKAATSCELYAWREEPLGRLAEIIILDQFSRNMFRDQAESFAYDNLALALAQEAIRQKADEEVEEDRRFFFYMPFMHSESKSIHKRAVKLFSKTGMESSLDFELKHKAIIDRFGRYPHRNKILGRVSTSEELEFLDQPGSSF